jgi:transcription initiation factor TFIIB
VIPKILAIDRYISNLVKSTRIDPRVGRLATEIDHKSNNHLLVDGKSPNALVAAYLYFAAILLGVNLPLSSLAGITEFQIRSRCKDLLTSFKITISLRPRTQRRHHGCRIRHS